MSAALAACNGPSLPGRLIAPNPYGYLKKSSFCQVSPVKSDKATRKLAAEMAVKSDDGLCTLTLKKQGGGQYASFGVVPHPLHGKVLTYNYEGQTYINYRADTAYSGKDAFSVVLIPSRDAPRWTLDTVVNVQAAPTSPTPPVATVAKPAAKTVAPKAKSIVRKSKTHPRHFISKKRK